VLAPEERQKMEALTREGMNKELAGLQGDTICPINRPLKTGDVITRSDKKVFLDIEYESKVSEKVMGWGSYKSNKVLVTKTFGTMRLVTESEKDMPKSLKVVGYKLYKYPVAIPVKGVALLVDTSDKDRERGFGGARITQDYTVTR